MTFVSARDGDFKDFFNVNDAKTKVLLDGALLNKSKGPEGDQYSFIHKTILELFAACAGAAEAQKIVDGSLSGKKNRGKFIKRRVGDKIQEKVAISEDEVDSVFNDTLVIDTGMMQFYSDMVKNVDGGELFKANLFKIIEMSKSAEIPITYAASNAIQILNQAGICFYKCDFSGIRVPDANLYKVFFSEANLSQSDLSGCNLTSSFL